MTDAEIIKALECCYDLDSSAICHQCPLYQTENCRDGYLGLQALHLINRQKAEIERLKEPKMLIANIEVSEDVLEKLINQKVISIANDKADVNFLCDKHIRTEAIKEFAERLCKDRVSNDPVVIAVKVELEMAGDTE